MANGLLVCGTERRNCTREHFRQQEPKLRSWMHMSMLGNDRKNMFGDSSEDQTLSQVNCIAKEFGLYSCVQELNIVNG